MFLTRPTSKVVLSSFYHQVTPAGKGWRKVLGDDIPPAEVKLPNQLVLISTLVVLFGSLSLIAWHTLKLGIKSNRVKPSIQSALLLILTTVASVAIYWNSSQLPNIAWDSWMVWVGKADQWMIHGLSVQINQFEQWSQDSHSIYNSAAHYPDGLSLSYFLPYLLMLNHEIDNSLSLFASALITLFLLRRLTRRGAHLN